MTFFDDMPLKLHALWAAAWVFSAAAANAAADSPGGLLGTGVLDSVEKIRKLTVEEARRVLGQKALPSPLRKSVEDLFTGREDSQWG